jgi:hypothetical protein
MRNMKERQMMKFKVGLHEQSNHMASHLEVQVLDSIAIDNFALERTGQERQMMN